MKVLVTGGSGKIGMRTMQVLQKAGHKVTDFDIVPPKEGDYKFIKGSLTNRRQVNRALKGMDVVVHLAAYPTETSAPTYLDMWDVNHTGSFNIFEYAIKNNLKKIVYASSICATGLITWVTPNHSIEYIILKRINFSINLLARLAF